MTTTTYNMEGDQMERPWYVGNKFTAEYRMNDGETCEISFVAMDEIRAREVAKEIGVSYLSGKYRHIAIREGDI